MFRLVLAVLLVTACVEPAPPPAPDALDGNLRWFWTHADALEDAALRDGAAKLALAGKAESRTEPLKGRSRTPLSAADLAVVGLEHNDPAAARGMVLVNVFPCSLSKLEELLIAKEQQAQYVDVYDAYSRTFTSDFGAFASGRSSTLSWDIDLKVTLPVADTYTAKDRGGIRRVSAPVDSATRGPFLITRTWLDAPAAFVNPESTSYFRQDYQVEVFWQQTPDTIFHAVADWREIKLGGFNLTLEDSAFLGLSLDYLVKWDAKTAELCKKM